MHDLLTTCGVGYATNPVIIGDSHDDYPINMKSNIYAGISIRMYFFSCSNNNVIDTCSAAGSSDNMYHVNNDIDIDESCSES